MEVQDVVALMKEGKTLAQIITDNQGNVDAIVATLVDRLREGLQEKVDSGEITQEQLDQRMANAEERITVLLNGERPAGGAHRYGKVRQVIQVVSEALGMEVQDVVALMKEGKTLAQIITDNQGNVDAIVATLVDRLREGLQEKVDSGDITQEQLDQRMANAEERITALLNGERPAGGAHRYGKVRQVIQVVSDALGMEVQDVVALMKEGKTLAQIITDNQGDVDAIVATLVDRLREGLQEKVDSGDITQEQMDQRMANAEERIAALLNGERPAGGAHRYGKVRQVIQLVSDALGMEAQDVVALMKEGKTLAQIITDNEGDVDAIVDTLVDRLREGLQEKVDSGDITQEQMDQRMANAEERIAALLNGERPAGMHGKTGDSQTFDGRFGGRVRSGDRRLESRDGDLQGSFRGGSALSGDLSAERGRFRAQTWNRSQENLQSLLQEAVDTGRTTQEQMDRRLARLLEGQPDGFSRLSFGSGFARTTGDR